MHFELIKTFARIGLFTIGGGYAMIPLIEAEVVDKHKWLEKDELLDLMAVAQSCPGIFAINISIFIGYKKAGTLGAFLCALGTALPSFLIILLLATIFQQCRENIYVEKIFRGIRPAVVALIAAPVFKMAKSAKISRYNVWIPIVAAIGIWLFDVNPILVILAAGIGGLVYSQLIEEE